MTLIELFHEAKSVRQNHIHFFRVRDCYDAFGDDAEMVAKMFSVPLVLHKTGTPMVVVSEMAAIVKRLQDAGSMVALHDNIQRSGSPKAIPAVRVPAGLFDGVED